MESGSQRRILSRYSAPFVFSVFKPVTANHGLYRQWFRKTKWHVFNTVQLCAGLYHSDFQYARSIA